MSQPRTFYVLGAGASYGLIPTTQQMRELIQRDYAAFGIYPGEPSPRSPLHDAVIGRPTLRLAASFEEILSEMLLQNIKPGALHFLIQKQLYSPLERIAPPQYAVFDVVGCPATLFNFNLDGLASRFCSHNHLVLEPHGRSDRLWFENAECEYRSEATIEGDVRLPDVIPKLLPSPEPADLVQQRDYRRARRLLLRSSAMVIIGYSFGNRDGRFDDAASWQFFVNVLKEFRQPIFVLSPFPEELANILRQNLSSNQVFGVPVYWEKLAMCLLAAAGPPRRLPSIWSDKQVHDLVYEYQRS